MIPVEGRVIPGLDEFMLRLGHLKVVCVIANEVGAPWRRIEKEVSAVLTTPVEVREEQASHVARYLRVKHLCSDLNSQKNDDSSILFRYPDLVVGDNWVRLRNDRNIDGRNELPRIQWQDFCLAHPDVRSRVGAVTVQAKSGSKTGLSHVYDWAALLDLIAMTGQLSPEGKLLAAVSGPKPKAIENWNPYLLKHEVIVPAYAYFRGDMDVFARFARKLGTEEPPLRKSTCRHLFALTMEEIAEEAEASRLLTSNARYRLFQQIRDLEKAGRKADKLIGETSTAWHRAASRLETYVDIGLLEKARTSELEKYEYVYYPTPKLTRAVELVEESTSGQEWLDRHFVSVITGSDREVEPSDDELLQLLPDIVAAINSPSRILPIDTVALGISHAQAALGLTISTGTARSVLENLARRRPELARLSRGTRGERAEFVSLDLRQLKRR